MRLRDTAYAGGETCSYEQMSDDALHVDSPCWDVMSYRFNLRVATPGECDQMLRSASIDVVDCAALMDR
jgi:hypothetical protein